MDGGRTAVEDVDVSVAGLPSRRRTGTGTRRAPGRGFTRPGFRPFSCSTFFVLYLQHNDHCLTLSVLWSFANWLSTGIKCELMLHFVIVISKCR